MFAEVQNTHERVSFESYGDIQSGYYQASYYNSLLIYSLAVLNGIKKIPGKQAMGTFNISLDIGHL
jgi:hypothetical protein